MVNSINRLQDSIFEQPITDPTYTLRSTSHYINVC